MKNKDSNVSREICVFYNSACPVCNAGIESQKKKTPQHEVSWQDIHLDSRQAMNISSDIEKLRKYLHVTDTQGRVRMGIDAFIVIWKNSRNQHWLAKLVSLPLIYTLAKAGYFVFANGLYWWNRWKKHW